MTRDILYIHIRTFKVKGSKVKVTALRNDGENVLKSSATERRVL